MKIILRFGSLVLVIAVIIAFAYLALPCEFQNINCGENGNCQNGFNDYSCSCGNGTMKANNLPSSACITDYCYGIDCKKGVCQVSSNDYNCKCDQG